jgi:hypothetical protein
MFHQTYAAIIRLSLQIHQNKCILGRGLPFKHITYGILAAYLLFQIME